MENHLASCLEGTLSPDSATRNQAEAALLQVHADPGSGLALAHLVLASHQPWTVRQSAAVSLRKWLRERWSPLHESFVGFPPSGTPVQSQDKAPVRMALLQALALPGHEARKLRVAAAASLSIVCSSDWPDEFPELLPTVHAMLQSQSPSQEYPKQHDDAAAVHGALAFLSEFWTSEMDERQILGGAKEILPTIESLLADDTAYGPSLRCRCVLIFRQLLSSLFMVRDVYPDAAKQIAADVLPRWIPALQAMASSGSLVEKLGDAAMPDDDRHGHIALVNEVWRTLKITTHFRSQVKPYLADLLSSAITVLQQLQEPFNAFYLTPDVDPPFAVPDGDGDIQTTLPNLLCSITEFVAEAIRGDRAKTVLLPGDDSAASGGPLLALITALIGYARVTTEEEEEWSSDPNAFVAASDEDGVEYGLRVACADLVQDLLDAYPRPGLTCLGQAVQQASASASVSWKGIEAALAVLGGVADDVQDLLDSAGPTPALDIQSIFQTAVLPSVQGSHSPSSSSSSSSSSSPLLTGRAYIFASQYAFMLPQDLAQQFLQASVQALEAPSLGTQEETLIVKLSAVRCVKNFYRHLTHAVLKPYTPRVIATLGPLLAQATEETLVLVLETIQCVVGGGSEGDGHGDEGISPQTYAQIVTAALSVWQRNPKDFLLLSVISDLLESLAGQTSLPAATAVLSAAHPLLATSLHLASSPRPDSPEDANLLEPAMDLVEALLRGAKAPALHQTQAASHLVGPVLLALERTDDRDVLQSGMAALASMVKKVCPDFIAWTPADSSSSSPSSGSGSPPAIERTFGIISRLLVLETESGGLKVGDLIIALLRRAPSHVLPVLPDLLRAMVTRLAHAQTASFAQSLILPFAFLLRDEGNAGNVLSLLEESSVTLPELSPEGARTVSGLEALMTKWVDNASTFQGHWAQKTSTLALSRLLAPPSGAPPRASLDGISVPGDALPDFDVDAGAQHRIRTRSRAKAQPTRYATVALPVKLLKVLLGEMASACEGEGQGLAGQARSGRGLMGGMSGGADAADADDDDDDDEDGEWDDEDEGDVPLSQLLSMDPEALAAAAGDDDDEDEDEDEAAADEAVRMDVKTYLSQWLRGLVRDAEQQGQEEKAQRARALIEALNDGEKQFLRKVVG